MSVLIDLDSQTEELILKFLLTFALAEEYHEPHQLAPLGASSLL